MYLVEAILSSCCVFHANIHVSTSTTYSKLITCGSDGDVRIWPESGDDDPIHTCVGEWSLCVRQKLDKIYVGTDCNNVQILTYPDGEREGILKKFTAHVNQIVMGNDHNVRNIPH